MSITYHTNILQEFRKTLTSDKSYAKPHIVSWEYQDRRAKRKANYKEGLPEDFYQYEDPKDLSEWLQWMLNVEKSNILSESLISDMVKRSAEFDKKIFADIQKDFDADSYSKGIGTYNAQDFYFANLTPSRSTNEQFRVLDFGAGFGRQSNLWLQERPDVVYIGMDAIPKSYCLQHYYYSKTDKLIQDYVLQSESFSLLNAESGIHHLPTWRWDLIPDNYLDEILLVQVIQEMNSKLVREMMKQFHRMLKPGGSIYIRDKESKFRQAHRLNTEQLFSENGFTLEYKAHLHHPDDIHGIPRIWRKTRPEVESSSKITLNQRMKELALDVDVMTRGKLKGIIKGNK